MSRINSDRGKLRICYEISGDSGPQKSFVISGSDDADELMRQIRVVIRDLAAKPGCSSVVIGIHRTGPACDHE